MAQHNELGKWGEQVAADYLASKGYNIVFRDWRYRHIDLDIIAVKDGVLAIVEVKTRSFNRLVEPELAVDRRKIRTITIAANAFVKSNRIDLEIRFDIIAITGSPANYTLNHIEDAFLPSL